MRNEILAFLAARGALHGGGVGGARRALARGGGIVTGGAVRRKVKGGDENALRPVARVACALCGVREA